MFGAYVNGASYTFGPFRLIPSEHLLLREETPTPLAPKTFDLLVALVSRHGQLLTRDELMKTIWPDSFVEEINLTVNISLLRRTLGEQPDGRQYIATVPKRGYRFDGAVTECGNSLDGAKPLSEPPPFLVPSMTDEPIPVASVPSAESTPIQKPRSPIKRLLIVAAALFFVLCASWIAYRKLIASRNQAANRGDQSSGVGQTVDPHAQALYAQGRTLLAKRSAESVQQSVELFSQAIAIDPKYTAAYAGLADAYILAGSYGNSFLSPQTAMPKAKAAAETALALDNNSTEAHASLAYIKLIYDWDWNGAEAEFRRALQLNPNYLAAHHWYSHELMAEGRVQESHEQSEQALAIDPLNVLMNEHMAWHHMMAREYDRSIPQALKTIELDPDFVQAHRVLALDYLYTGRFKEACAEFEKGVTLSHDDPIARAYLARCYALSHRQADARQIVDALVKASVERYVSAAEIAAVYAALNDDEVTMKWINKACDERASALIYLNVDPIYDRIRRDPRFQSMVRRVNVVPLLDEPAAK
jgi:DNA-binding winged helix-turn-helix (wHTH) protein/tetratricopeptide (TPR) repeat protein